MVKLAKARGLTTMAVENHRAQVEALQERAKLLRAELRMRILEKASDALARMDAPHTEWMTTPRNPTPLEVTYERAPADAFLMYSKAAATLMREYRLEVGEPTDHTKNSGPEVLQDHERETLAQILQEELARREVEPAAADVVVDAATGDDE